MQIMNKFSLSSALVILMQSLHLVLSMPRFLLIWSSNQFGKHPSPCEYILAEMAADNRGSMQLQDSHASIQIIVRPVPLLVPNGGKQQAVTRKHYLLWKWNENKINNNGNCEANWRHIQLRKTAMISLAVKNICL